MLQQPLHPLPQPGPTANTSATSISEAPALLRRLADPGQGATAALAFLTLQAAQRGPGWVQQTLPPLLDWLAEPKVTALPYAPEPYSLSQAGTQHAQQAAAVGSSHGSRRIGGDAAGGGSKALERCGLPPDRGFGLAPRALSFPLQLQPQLRQLLAALPRCPKLYDGLDARRRQVLQELTAALPRGCDAVAASAGIGGSSMAAARGTAGKGAPGACTGRGYVGSRGSGGSGGSGSGGWRPPQSGAATLGVGGVQGSVPDTATAAAWVQAALQASRLRYQRRPAPQPPQPPQLPQLPGQKPQDAVPAATAPVAALDGCPEDGGWWWIPEDPAVNQIYPLDLGFGQRDGTDLDPDPDTGAAPPATPGGPVDGEAGTLSRRRRAPFERRASGAGEERPESEEDTDRVGVGDEGKFPREGATRAERNAATSAAPPGAATADRCAAADVIDSPPPAKRLRTAAAAEAPKPSEAAASLSNYGADGAAGTGDGGGGRAAADPPPSLGGLLRALQEAVGGDGGDGDGAVAASAETWRRLEALLERCAASGVPYSDDSGGGDSAATAAAATPPLPADAVLLLVRQLVTPRLSGAAARLLLGCAVLPAVVAGAELRVVPRPLQEALTAAGGPHPRPLAEAVLIPAVQRPGLTAAQAQLLVKAATAGTHPLPRPLQALVLRAAAAVGSEWGEPHLAVVQGLVEAAKEGLDQETLGLVSQGLCAAARAAQQQQPQGQQPQKPPTTTRSGAAAVAGGVPLCRLLLSLLTRHGGGLAAPQLRQLAEAASATSTFLTKPCLSKLQELLGTGGGGREKRVKGGDGEPDLRDPIE